MRCQLRGRATLGRRRRSDAGGHVPLAARCWSVDLYLGSTSAVGCAWSCQRRASASRRKPGRWRASATTGKVSSRRTGLRSRDAGGDRYGESWFRGAYLFLRFAVSSTRACRCLHAPPSTVPAAQFGRRPAAIGVELGNINVNRKASRPAGNRGQIEVTRNAAQAHLPGRASDASTTRAARPTLDRRPARGRGVVEPGTDFDAWCVNGRIAVTPIQLDI